MVMVGYYSKDAEEGGQKKHSLQRREREIKEKRREAVIRGPHAHDGGSITKMAATQAAASTSRAATTTSSQAFLKVTVYIASWCLFFA